MKDIVVQFALLVFAFQQEALAQIEVTEPTSPVTKEYTSTLCSDGLVEIIANAKSGDSVVIDINKDYNDGGFSIAHDLLYCNDSKIFNNRRTNYVVEIRFKTNFESDGTVLRNFTVRILNIPEPPKFTSPPNNATFHISENTTANTVITNLTATEPDCTFSVKRSNLFYVNGNKLQTAATVVNNTFDVDGEGTVTRHTLNLRASKGMSFDEITVTIVIDDINDNSPQFGQPSYYFPLRVNEHSKVEEFDYTIEATDADRTNNKVKYEITDTSFMRIDSSTGVIRLENGTTFTCSSARMYTFRVIATDSAEEGFRRSSETTITVNVTLDPKLNCLHPEENGTESTHCLGWILIAAVVICLQNLHFYERT